jgi:hypothetical protein
MPIPRFDGFPERPVLVELLRNSSQREVAAYLGCAQSTLSKQVKREGIDISEYATSPTRREQTLEYARKGAKTSRADSHAALIADEVSETEILQQRVKELQTALRKDKKGAVQDERLMQAIETSAAASLPVYNPPKRPRKQRTGKAKPEHEMVLLWSDTHAGEVVSSEETNGINRYNWDILWKRQAKLRESLFSYAENRPYPIEKLHVAALGDMLSGNIHDELVATNEEPLSAVLADFSSEGAAWLSTLHSDGGGLFSDIEFSGVVGNHPRAHRKPWAKKSFDNGDWITYRWMETLLRNHSGINFSVPRSASHVMDICNRKMFIFHGDGIRSTMPGVPWGGVMRRVNTIALNYMKQVGVDIDLFACGHFHNSSFVNTDAGGVFINGSVKGPDEYSMAAFGGGRPAQQLLLTFHPKHGLTDMSFIDLQDIT